MSDIESIEFACMRDPKWAAKEIQRLREENARLLDAANVALGHLTGGMDGDWRDVDPAELLRQAIEQSQDKEP